MRNKTGPFSLWMLTIFEVLTTFFSSEARHFTGHFIFVLLQNLSHNYWAMVSRWYMLFASIITLRNTGHLWVNSFLVATWIRAEDGICDNSFLTRSTVTSKSLVQSIATAIEHQQCHLFPLRTRILHLLILLIH